MKFTRKKTCKGCQLENDYSYCTVIRIPEFAYGPDVPQEPCFKPKTNADISIFMDSMVDIQKANLEVERVNDQGV